MSDDVMIAVASASARARLGPVTKTVIESARFANSAEGYARLTGFAARWDQRQWAVEGCHGTGRSLRRERH